MKSIVMRISVRNMYCRLARKSRLLCWMRSWEDGSESNSFSWLDIRWALNWVVALEENLRKYPLVEYQWGGNLIFIHTISIRIYLFSMLKNHRSRPSRATLLSRSRNDWARESFIRWRCEFRGYLAQWRRWLWFPNTNGHRWFFY